MAAQASPHSARWSTSSRTPGWELPSPKLSRPAKQFWRSGWRACELSSPGPVAGELLIRPCFPALLAFCDTPSGPTSERESLPTTLHEGTARHTYFPVLFKSPLFYLLEVVRPERLELPAPICQCRFSLTV